MYVATSSTALDYAKTAQMKDALQKINEKNKNPFLMRPEQENQAAIAKRTQEIKNKMKAGLRLSFDEKEFLRVNNPALYEKAIEIEKERDEHRRQLARCKTKEEVRRVQLLKSSQLQTDSKNAPEDYETTQMRAMAISNENMEFTSSKDFEELPESELEEEKEKRKGKKSKFGGVYQNALEIYLQNMRRSFNNTNVETNTEQKNNAPETEEPKIMTPNASENNEKSTKKGKATYSYL